MPESLQSAIRTLVESVRHGCSRKGACDTRWIASCVRSKPSLLCISPYRSTRGCAPLVWLNSLPSQSIRKHPGSQRGLGYIARYSHLVVRHRSGAKGKIGMSLSGYERTLRRETLSSFIAILHLRRVCDAASRCEGTAVLVLYLSLRSRTRLCAWMVQKETYDIIPNICMHIHA
jgi:hypothetical protein